MSISNPMGKIDFPNCLRTILYESYGETEAETYAYYQKNCGFMFKTRADIVEFSPHYFKLQAAVHLFECACFIHEDIELFEIVSKKSGDEVTLLSRAHFFDIRNDFYENDGRRINSEKGPMSTFYSSDNILEYLGKHMGFSLFGRGLILNEVGEQMQSIYWKMKKRTTAFLKIQL